jgi:peptidoglycan-N-acetylglucosamine deacetylase
MKKYVVSILTISSLLTACSPEKFSTGSTPIVASGTSEKVFQQKSITGFGLRGTKQVVLTYDDGPVHGTTEPLLDLLRDEHIRGTFFMIGQHASANPVLMRRIQREGHIIANHTEDHISLRRPEFAQNPQELVNEIALAHYAISPYLTPNQKLYFRAPEGDWRPAHAAILNSLPELRPYIGPVYWDEGGELNPAPQRGVPYFVSPEHARSVICVRLRLSKVAWFSCTRLISAVFR